MFPGGAAVRSCAEIDYNTYLYFTYFDKPQCFNMMQGNEVAESSFFECEKLNFHETEKDKLMLKGEFLLSNISSFC